MVKAVNDQFEPADSKDQSTNYLHWWPAKDTTEWVQYDFDHRTLFPKVKCIGMMINPGEAAICLYRGSCCIKRAMNGCR